MKHPLEQLQKEFSQLILSSESNAAPTFFATEVQLTNQRLAIYRGNLQSIWISTLRNSFPVLQQLVGEDFFAYLALQYGRQFPSQSGDLNQFGSQFAYFLAHEPSVASYAYFPAVAALEWQMHCAYYAQNIMPISLAEFLSVAADAAQQCRLFWHPAAQLFQADYAAAQVVLAHQIQPIVAIDVPLDTPCQALLSRASWRVELSLLDSANFLALQALERGQTLGDALALALAHDAQFDIPLKLQSWFASGIFVGFECKE